MRTLPLLLFPFLAVTLAAQGTALPFGTGCPTAGPRATGFAPNPGAGRILLCETGAVPGSLPFAALGFSSSQWGAYTLPLPLTTLGLPSCSLLVEPLSVVFTPLVSGVAEYSTVVPGLASLAGAQVFGQWLNFNDPRVSAAMPVTFSDGVAFTLGTSLGMPGFTITGDPTSVNGATWTYVATVGGVSYDLQGRLFKPATPPGGGRALYPAVILSHGNGGNANAYSANVAHAMVTWGLVCIMTNLTHAGGVPLGAPGLATERGSSTANVLRNRKCVDLLQSLGYVDLRRLAAHGHSMGAWATGALLGSHPALFLAASHTAGGMSTQVGSAATTLAQAMAIRTPYQLHHGDADTTVPLIMDQALANQLAANPTVHQLVVYPGYTHSQIASDATMLAAVRAWYTAHQLLP